MSKSHVSLEQALCPVCAQPHTTGILLDRRLKDSLEPKTITHWAICKDDQAKYDEGYIALVGTTNSGTGDTLTLETAQRSGEIVHIRRAVWNQVFDCPLPRSGKNVSAMVFVEPQVIEFFKSAKENASV